MTLTTPASVLTEAVEYDHDGTRLKGFLAYDADSHGQRPGVLVFSEWWGLTELARNRARQLAALGYVALAADVYGEGRVIEMARPEEAAQAAGALRADPAAWRGRAAAALTCLTGHPAVDPAKLAAIGYCLDTALQLAYSGADLKAVLLFHSALPLPTAAEAAVIRGDVLVCVGGADPFVPGPAVTTFRAALDAAGVTIEVVSYPGVGHSFTSPLADRVGNPGMRYDRPAAEDAWARMTGFLAVTFGDA